MKGLPFIFGLNVNKPTASQLILSRILGRKKSPRLFFPAKILDPFSSRLRPLEKSAESARQDQTAHTCRLILTCTLRCSKIRLSTTLQPLPFNQLNSVFLNLAIQILKDKDHRLNPQNSEN